MRQHEADALAASPPLALMQRAGAATARLALALAPHARRVWIAAGPGNNGGDGVEAALRLRSAGRQVWLTASACIPGAGPEDARQAWARAAAAGLCASDAFPAPLGPQDLIIDALLGLGAAQRPLQGHLAEAAEHMLSLRSACGVPILSIDLPSGLDADRGCWPPQGPRLRADHTLSLLGLKTGHFTADGRDACGRVWFDDLGMPPDAAFAQAWLVGADIVNALPARAHAQHKGSFGQVWVIGGAPGMQGAAHLAAAAALQVGAGRVRLATLDRQAALPAGWPELMPCTPEAALDAAVAARDGVDARDGQDVWVAGCGGGTDIATLLPELLDSAPRLVLDADALNAIAASGTLQLALRRRANQGRRTVLTPHPLEAARLLGCSTQDLQSDRLGRAQALAERDQVHVVLKGSGTVTTAPGARPALNGSGHAALATAGSGDVLGGLIGGLWAQGLEPLEATRLAVWRHGRIAEVTGRARLRASDLLQA